MRRILRDTRALLHWHWATLARRGPLWVFFAMLASVPLSSATVPQRDVVRSGPRNVRVEIVVQEVDSILWGPRWVQPQIVGGAPDPQRYEYEVEIDDDPTGFEIEGPADVSGSAPGTAREVQFWTPYTCPDTLYVHVRVRGHGEWDPSTTPWGYGTGSFSRECSLPPAPGPPEVTVDTVQTDTTDVELQLRGAGWFPGRVPQELEWSPWTTYIVTDSLTGEVIEREIVHQCWYMASVYPDSIVYHWKTPGICPDVGFVTEEELAVMPDSLMEVRCAGVGGGGFTEWTRADQADLDCGGVVRYQAGGPP